MKLNLSLSDSATRYSWAGQNVIIVKYARSRPLKDSSKSVTANPDKHEHIPEYSGKMTQIFFLRQ